MWELCGSLSVTKNISTRVTLVNKAAYFSRTVEGNKDGNILDTRQKQQGAE